MIIEDSYIEIQDGSPYLINGPEVSIIHEVICDWYRTGYMGYDDDTYSECARDILNKLAKAGYTIMFASKRNI